MRGRLTCPRPGNEGSMASSAGENGHAFTPKTSNVCAGRVAFVLCLMATAVILGFLAHISIARSEEGLATAQYDALADQYDSIADRALVAALHLNLNTNYLCVDITF